VTQVKEIASSVLQKDPCSLDVLVRQTKATTTIKKERFRFDDMNRCIATTHNVTGNEAIQDASTDSRDGVFYCTKPVIVPHQERGKGSKDPIFPTPSGSTPASVPNNLPDPKSVPLYALYIDNTLEQIGRIGRALSLSIDI